MQATTVLKQLKSMRTQKQAHVQNLDTAISALEGVTERPIVRVRGQHLSVTARRAIGKAQKARWAKWRKKNGK